MSIIRNTSSAASSVPASEIGVSDTDDLITTGFGGINDEDERREHAAVAAAPIRRINFRAELSTGRPSVKVLVGFRGMIRADTGLLTRQLRKSPARRNPFRS